MTRSRFAGPIVLLAAAFVISAAAFVAAQEFTSVWRNPEAGPLAFAGKKVVAVVMTGTQSLEMSGEEELVRQLNSRGVNGVAAYRTIPREELQDVEKAKAWVVTRLKADGVVVMRVLSSDKQTSYRPSMWVTSSYSTLWSYWGTGWTSVWVAGKEETNRFVSAETLIYNVPKDQLVWAGVSDIKNPKNIQKEVASIVTGAVAEMKKNGLIPK